MNFAIFDGHILGLPDGTEALPPARILGSIDYDIEDFRSEFADLNAGGDCYRADNRLLRFIEHMFGNRILIDDPTLHITQSPKPALGAAFPRLFC